MSSVVQCVMWDVCDPACWEGIRVQVMIVLRSTHQIALLIKSIKMALYTLLFISFNIY